MNYKITVVDGRLEVLDVATGIIHAYDFKENGVAMNAKNLCHWIKKLTKRVTHFDEPIFKDPVNAFIKDLLNIKIGQKLVIPVCKHIQLIVTRTRSKYEVRKIYIDEENCWHESQTVFVFDSILEAVIYIKKWV